MRSPRFAASVLVVIVLAVSTGTASATWPHDPGLGNVAVCLSPNSQAGPGIVSDGAGGAIIAWYDYRSLTSYDIYVQRLSAAGVPLWTANGVPLCTGSGEQLNLSITSDGAGGAIVAWEDSRSGAGDIYAQRVNAAGSPLWTPNGVALCLAASFQGTIRLVSDGAGGAIASWRDLRSGSNYDIYAQRLSAGGAAQWAPNGIALCTIANDQLDPAIASDGAGGAIVTWSDFRSASTLDIYAQRINASGTPLWTANGQALSLAADTQSGPMIVADGAGGAIVTWLDYRGANPDIYAQRVSAAGTPQWTGDGVVVCAAALNQYEPRLASDGTGGAIVTWHDGRSGAGYDVYAQRIGAGGSPLWTANGVALCTATGDQAYAWPTSDGAGGAIVAWTDYRGLTGDIYAQRISGAGTTQWAFNGVATSTAVSNQTGVELAPDGAGGAIATWYDFRNGTYDIYAQRVERYGQLGNPEPRITAAKDVPNDQGGSVKVSWDASYLDADPDFGVSEYRVFRSAPGSLAPGAAAPRAMTEDSDVAVREGALLATNSAGATVYWEYVGTQVAEALAGYSRVVATTSDSVGGSNPLTLFMVEARASASLSADRWASAPDSGYSVDNLPPATPAPFTGQYAAGTAHLHWNPNVEADLAGYRLYRGASMGFVPGPGNLVGALSDTGYTDSAGAPYVYKLTAVDAHGNESPVATLLPSDALDVSGVGPLALSFAAPSPNPASGGTTLHYTLSRVGHVQLAVFDAAGRRVLVLRDSEMAAGPHDERFALRDEAGRGLASGLYLLRLEAEGRVLVRRLAAIR
jgi:hypothetical protein